MHADEYPMQFPWLGWASGADTHIEPDQRAEGPILDLHRGLGPSAAKAPAANNTQRLQGTLVGEIVSVAIRETGGMIGLPVDLELWGGTDETGLFLVSTMGNLAANAIALYVEDFAWPFVQLQLHNTDLGDVATLDWMMKVRGHLRP